ncbi:MAG: endonuclease III [Candidatus Parvarchaeota archaeon]|nr:endonuclease III [Candidatus Parvarchaeota archaeon]
MTNPVILDRENAEKALKLLEKNYPNAKYYLDFVTPIDLVVAAILSAQTHDSVVNSVTRELFKKYRTAKDYASAKESDLLSYVNKVTFAGNKVKNIIKTCSVIADKYGGKVPDKMDDLVNLPGIGRKTANTILINAYGIVEGIPVDTWVIKLSYRIGFSSSNKPEKIEQDLIKLVDKTHWKNIAYILKAHGHEVCHSSMPLCSKCFLNDICPKNGVEKHG